MRVLYVNQTADVSGAERSLLALLDGLGDRVEPLLACPDGTLAGLAREAGIRREPIVGTQASFRLHPLHTSRGLAEIGRSALQVRRLARRHAPALVHANTTRAALLALLARRPRPPVLAHIRDWAPEGRFSRAVLGVVARRADLVVANSAYIAGQFDGLALRQPVEVIHNPVDLGKFDPAKFDREAARREFGLKPSTVVLAVVAQLTPWKGQDDAIRALAGLRTDQGSDVALLLAGSAKFSGPGTQFDNRAYERGLHELASQLGVADRVHFLGERGDVPNVLAATDLLLLPSWQEAFGRIAIEAMAMGVPVIATAAGGPAEIVRPGVDGLLLAPRQPDAWARGLEPLVESGEARERMGAAGRERARDFSLAVHAERMLGAYRRLT
ncbi:MAG TPA: glycosyltransferase family 4 protein [Solirubrobacterales bacterium]|jgi:glycosyltransferase involved in cell wall biosynthesis|nr:glycosyltransferase family 4 protein [Solirubrobacterales bacterium]